LIYKKNVHCQDIEEVEGRVSIPGRINMFLSFIASRMAFGLTQPSGRGVKLVPRSTMVELYQKFPIRLHGVVLN
jgi:hypothetical protein